MAKVTADEVLGVRSLDPYTDYVPAIDNNIEDGATADQDLVDVGYYSVSSGTSWEILPETTLLGVDLAATSANLSVYLPLVATTTPGKIYRIVHESTSAPYKVTVYPNGHEDAGSNVTISGASSFVFDYRLSSVAFYNNGTNWYHFNTRQSDTAIGTAPAIANYADSDVVGEIIRVGTGTTVKGKLYFLWSDLVWHATDSDTPLYSGATMLAVAAGTNAATDGMLIRGLVRVDSAYVDGTPIIGRQVFVSEDTGDFDFTAPSGSGDAVRCVGHCLGTTGGDILVLFDPSRDYVQIS